MSENEKSVLVPSDNPFIVMFQQKTMDSLRSCLNNDKAVRKFITAIKICFARNEKLAKCSKDSLFDVFLACAEWNLYPSATTGDCYVIPYKVKGVDTATFQLGYQGMITLAYRAGCKQVLAEVVCENDRFKYEYGLNQTLKHIPVKFGGEDAKGKPIGAYAIITLESGKSIMKIMDAEEIFAFRNKSQSYSADLKYKSTNSPWQPKNDPQLNMWKKTVIKQLFKMIPKTPIIHDVLEHDTKGDVERGESILNVGAPQIEDNVKYASKEDVEAAYAVAIKEGWPGKDMDITMEKITETKPVDTSKITEAHLKEFKVAIYQGIPA